MASKKSISTKIQLDGEKEFRKAITQCNASLRMMGQEMKLLQQAYKGNENSTEALIAKDKLLNKEKEEQIKKISNLEKALQKAKETYGENSSKVQQYQNSLLQAQTQLQKINNEIEQNQSELKDLGRGYDELEKAIQENVIKLSEAKKQYGENSEEAKQYADVIKDLESTQKKMSEAIDLQNYKKLNDELALNEHSLDKLRSAYGEMVSTFGKTSKEAKDLEIQISKLENEQSNLKREIDKNDFSRMTKSFNENKESITKLKAEYKEACKQFGKNSQEAQGLKNEIQQLNREQKELKSSMNGMKSNLHEASEAMEELGQETEKTEKASSTFKETLKGVLAGNLATKGLELGFNVIKNTVGDTIGTVQDLQKAMNSFSASTGKNGEELKGYESILKEVFSDNYGESLEEVSEGMAKIVQQTNLTGDSLKNATENAFALRDTFGIDLDESLLAVNSLMKQFGINGEEAYNLITQGCQSGLNANGDLMDVINEYGVQYKNAGLSAEDFFNALANGAEQGTWSIDKLGDGFKEMTIRLNDGTVTDSLKEMGINAEGIAKGFQKGGEDSKKALGDLKTAITSIEDDTKRYQAGVAVFGRPYVVTELKLTKIGGI